MARAPRVVITGAASGLGRALAMAWARRGACVAVTDRDGAGAEAVLDALRAEGGTGFSAALDVTDETGFAAVAERVQAEWQGLDVLVNNAGVATAGTVLEAPVSQWQRALDINLLGAVRGVRAFGPLIARGGHVVNIASFAGIANPPAMASYNAAKAAVISLSESLRFELAPRGIGVSVACPAFFKTRLLETSAANAEAERDIAPHMGAIVARLMDKAQVTAEDVAADILGAVDRRRFLVITHRDSRRQALLKRLSPETYFRVAAKATRAFLGGRR